LSEASVTPPDARLANHIAHINRTFAADRYEAILAALEQDDTEWAANELATLHGKSPQACKVTLRLLAEGAAMPSFADEMRQEYRVACRVVRRHDFLEGVRALLVDKDNRPRWEPPAPEAVTNEMLDQIFAPLPEGEEWTPLEA
jgi:enoyl-CoA hydratase